MGKVVGSYPRITLGVSEQVPQDRRPGQMAEQVNMISDPLRGVARRHGSETLDEQKIVAAGSTAITQLLLRGYREETVYLNGTEYSLIYAAAGRPTDSALPFMFVFNKDTSQFLTVAYADDANTMASWTVDGVSAVTAVGSYVVMASNTLLPNYGQNDQYAAQSHNGVAWVRAGDYSRTYKLTVTNTAGQTFNASYTTEASSYPGTLDLSDLSPLNADGTTNTLYQKQVNDRTATYNSAVTSWIGTAAADKQPENIANKLAQQLQAAGFSTVGVVSSTIVFVDATFVSADDGGDGTLFRAVFNQIDSADEVSYIHVPGKVVKVQPTGTSADPYYLVAQATTSDTGWQPVTWVEGPASIIQPNTVFALGCISADGMTFTLGANPGSLASATGFTVPTYQANSCGDLDQTGAIPAFFGKQITLLTTFMDRLVISAGGVIFMSRTGDYFNWFRDSMLTVKDDDPIEAYALGAEDDKITRAVTYSKDLFMFGERFQFTISGRSILTPKTIAITTAAAEKDSSHSRPATIANLLFYGKYESAKNQTGPSPYAGRLWQFQLGLFEDAPEPYDVGQQLDKYLRGKPIELTALSSPPAVFMRTDGLDNGLYLYSFIDQAGSQQRLIDSWGRWEWDAVNVGSVIGISSYQNDLLVYMIRDDGTDHFVACERFSMDSQLPVTAHLDAQRPASSYATGVYLRPGVDRITQAGAVAIDSTQVSQFLGSALSGYDALVAKYSAVPLDNLTVGFPFDSYFDPTPPYIRDQNDKAVVNGRTTVGKYTLSLENTGGLDATVTHNGVSTVVAKFNGRKVGDSVNVVGRQPLATTSLDVPVGRANVEHQLRVRSRTWLPMIVTAIEWVGQTFNNARRV